MARSNVALLLRNETIPTQEQVKTAVKHVVSMFQSIHPNASIDPEMLLLEVLNNTNVFSPQPTELKNDLDNHVIWLPDKKANITWDFWNRYRKYQEDLVGLPESVIVRLNTLTDTILGHLEDPTRKGVWDRRGMVVGHVQSGKTSNYTGLICKAVDAGYKLVIVLAGTNNDLRSQTQLRLDEGFLGFDTRVGHEFNPQSKIGVGALWESGELVVHSLTSSADNGDYRTNVARNVHFMLGSDPVLLVVKKNASVLKNLLTWIRNGGRKDPDTGEVFRDNIPLLVIDDEADNASVDGRQAKRDENGALLEDEDPTKINQLIRQLLKTFQQSAYVGYTATPFANIFIYPPTDDSASSKYGEDLFPRSFIVNLPAPSNYIGPTQVFGLDEDEEQGIERTEGLPIVQKVDDFEPYIPNGHKKNDIVSLPPSLKRAIRAFIVTCAARLARKQFNKHNSMLIHVTRFTLVQNQIKDQVEEELSKLQLLLEYGEGASPSSLLKELEEIWTHDYEPTTRKVIERFNDLLVTPLTWSEVCEHLYEAASKIQVRAVNGFAKDVLDYRDHPNGMSVIAIGGDKLSRGLTLEGLSISYYLRASKMYDTLMQMGRWFGYRPGYVDLCRLYTSGDLIDWYKHIAIANEELRKDFDFMAASGRNPMQFGLKVRTHPDGLQITSTNKLRHGTKMSVTYSGNISETIVFYKDRDINKNNFLNTSEWISGLGAPKQEKNPTWLNVRKEKITEFLEQYQSHPFSRKSEPKTLIKYITKLPPNELNEWTVALVSNSRDHDPIQIGGHPIGLTVRQDSETDRAKWMIGNSRLISPPDELIDLDEGEFNRALKATRDAWKPRKVESRPPEKPSGPFIRAERSSHKGLLLIYALDHRAANSNFSDYPIMGFAISFPVSPSAKEVEYIVDTTFWRELYGDE